MKLQIDSIEVRMRAPVVSSGGSLGLRGVLLVRVETADGAVGFGEAAPLQSYDGVGLDDARAAIEDCRGALADSDGADREQLLAECRRLAVLPQALAAIDLALWDLAGRRASQPVWRLLGADSAPAVDVNATIAAADRATAATEAATARSAGFRCVKAKVGIGDDGGRLAAIRAAAGPDMEIRVDANGVWSVDEAEAALRAFEPIGIELCEEPVSGAEEIRRVAASTLVPIAIDETTATERICDAVCLKITRGGISAVLDSARRARALDYEVYLASTHDGPLGIAAALHAATAIGPDRPCGLATLSLFDRPDPLPARAGRISPPTGHGLGDGLLGWYGGELVKGGRGAR